MADVVLMDANNYTSLTTLALPTIQTAPGADLMVCWDGLMKDLLCHDIAADQRRSTTSPSCRSRT